MRVRRGSVRGYIVVAFGGVGAILVVLAALSFAVFPRQAASAAAQAHRYQDAAATDRAARDEVAAAEAALGDFRLTGDRADRSAFGRARAGFAAQAARLSRTAPADLMALAADQARAGGLWFAAAGQEIARRPPPGSAQARRLAAGERAAWSIFTRVSTATSGRLDSEAAAAAARSRSALEAGLAWDVGLALTGTIFGLTVALISVRGIISPLRELREVIQRRRGGDASARAHVAGAADVEAVAAEFNELADENDRLRAEELGRARLRSMARAASLRVREHMRAGDVLAEGSRQIAAGLRADLADVRLVTAGQGPDRGTPEAGQREAGLPVSGPWADDLLRKGAVVVVPDLAGPEAMRLPPWLQARARERRVASLVVAPVAEGSELAAVISAGRIRADQPWTPAEIDALEVIAAEVGRSLRNARLYQQEERLVANLRAVNEMRTEFFTTVAHELKSPLTSVEGYVEMLRDGDGGPVTDTQREMLDAVGRGSSRLRDLVEQLLTLSRVESGGTLELKPVNLCATLSSALDAARPTLAGGGLALRFSCPPQGLVVDGDPEQLNRAWSNLLSNAAKYTPRGGQVSVTGAAEGGSAIVTVRDTGIGIPQADLDRLFSRFFRASNVAGSRIQGSGLGLAIVRAVVAGHHGEIAVESREGQGSSFTVRLPLAGQGSPP